jgi:hypothetical protein
MATVRWNQWWFLNPKQARTIHKHKKKKNQKLTFNTSAAKTALLLTNAVIVDRSIVVEPLTAAHAPPPADAQMAAGDIQHKTFAVDDAQRSKTSVIASLIAAGYSVGTGTLAKAKDYDGSSR